MLVACVLPSPCGPLLGLGRARRVSVCLRGGGVDLDPAREFFLQGRERLQAGEADAALFYYEKAVQLAPSDGESLVALGRLLDQVRGNQQAAFDLFVRAVEAVPDSIVALSNYAFGLENWCHRPRLAEDVYRRSEALDPSNVPVLVNLAALLEQPLAASDPRCGEEAGSARLRQAHDLYTRALALEPENLNTLCNFAGMLMMHGDGGDDDSISGLHRGGQRASELLTRAMELAPDDTAVLINHGVLMEDWGDNKELARRLYQRAVGLDPANSAAVSSLVRILRILKRLPEAEQAARAAIALYPAESRSEAVLDIERELWRVQQTIKHDDAASGGRAPRGGSTPAHPAAHPRVERDRSALRDDLEDSEDSMSDQATGRCSGEPGVAAAGAAGCAAPSVKPRAAPRAWQRRQGGRGLQAGSRQERHGADGGGWADGDTQEDVGKGVSARKAAATNEAAPPVAGEASGEVLRLHGDSFLGRDLDEAEDEEAEAGGGWLGGSAQPLQAPTGESREDDTDDYAFGDCAPGGAPSDSGALDAPD